MVSTLPLSSVISGGGSLSVTSYELYSVGLHIAHLFITSVKVICRRNVKGDARLDYYVMKVISVPEEQSFMKLNMQMNSRL
jgi:hypothetical protein